MNKKVINVLSQYIDWQAFERVGSSFEVPDFCADIEHYLTLNFVNFLQNNEDKRSFWAAKFNDILQQEFGKNKLIKRNEWPSLEELRQELPLNYKL